MGCAQCASRDTWAKLPERNVTVETLTRWCTAQTGVEGVTITGGEPLEQAHAVATFVERLREWERARNKPLDILLYSGWPERRIRARYPELVARLDLLIPEPYAHTAGEGAQWRGSANQPLRVLSELGRERIARSNREAAPRTMSVSPMEHGTLLAGVPRSRDELTQLAEATRERGVTLKGTSWTD